MSEVGFEFVDLKTSQTYTNCSMIDPWTYCWWQVEEVTDTLTRYRVTFNIEHVISQSESQTEEAQTHEIMA